MAVKIMCTDRPRPVEFARSLASMPPSSFSVTEAQVEEAVRIHARHHKAVLQSATQLKELRQKRDTLRRTLLKSNDLTEKCALGHMYRTETAEYERCRYVLESQKLTFTKSQLDAQQKLFLQYFQDIDTTDTEQVEAWNALQALRREKEWCKIRCERQELLYELLCTSVLPDPLATDLQDLSCLLEAVDTAQTQLTQLENHFAASLKMFRLLHQPHKRCEPQLLESRTSRVSETLGEQSDTASQQDSCRNRATENTPVKVLSPFLPSDLQEELCQLDIEKSQIHQERGRRLARCFLKKSDDELSLLPGLKRRTNDTIKDDIEPSNGEASCDRISTQTPCVVPLVPSSSPASVPLEETPFAPSSGEVQQAGSEPVALPLLATSPYNATPLSSALLYQKKRRSRQLTPLLVADDKEVRKKFCLVQDPGMTWDSSGPPQQSVAEYSSHDKGQLSQLIHTLGFELNDEQHLRGSQGSVAPEVSYKTQQNSPVDETPAVQHTDRSVAMFKGTNSALHTDPQSVECLGLSCVDMMEEQCCAPPTLNPEEERLMLQAILEAPVLTQWKPSKDESSLNASAPETPAFCRGTTVNLALKTRPTLLTKDFKTHAALPGAFKSTVPRSGSSLEARRISTTSNSATFAHLTTSQSKKNMLLSQHGCSSIETELTSSPDLDEPISVISSSDDGSSPRAVGLLACPSDTGSHPGSQKPVATTHWVTTPSPSMPGSSSPFFAGDHTVTTCNSTTNSSPLSATPSTTPPPSCTSVTAPPSHDVGTSPPLSRKKLDILNYVFGCLVNMTGVFTMKTRVYQTKLKQLLPEPQAGTQRYILQLPDPPRIPTSRPELRTIKLLRAFPDTCSPHRRSTDSDGNHIVDLLDEFLTSVVNKVCEGLSLAPKPRVNEISRRVFCVHELGVHVS